MAALPVYQKQSQPAVGNGIPYASLPQQQPSRLTQPAALPSTAGILTPHMQVTISINAVLLLRFVFLYDVRMP